MLTNMSSCEAIKGCEPGWILLPPKHSAAAMQTYKYALWTLSGSSSRCCSSQCQLHYDENVFLYKCVHLICIKTLTILCNIQSCGIKFCPHCTITGALTEIIQKNQVQKETFYLTVSQCKKRKDIYSFLSTPSPIPAPLQPVRRLTWGSRICGWLGRLQPR